MVKGYNGVVLLSQLSNLITYTLTITLLFYLQYWFCDIAFRYRAHDIEYIYFSDSGDSIYWVV